LRKSKVLVPADGRPQFKYGGGYSKQFGTTFAYPSWETLRGLIEKTDGSEVARLADEVIKGGAGASGDPRTDASGEG
jgi:hypothetical protein